MSRAAERLRHSRRWRLANLVGAIGAWLRGRPAPGFGHLDRNVEKYQTWRTAHPEVDSIENEIQSLRSVAVLETSPPLKATGNSRPSDSAGMTPPAPTGPIEFPQHDEVEVSIVVPVFNQLRFTQACLAALQEHHDQIRFEVIVVDDCSTDATASEIGNLPGVVFLRNRTNAGFIASCNRGAQKARGRHLVFLNNDTRVTERWLSSLLETFDLQPKAGLVGSKLIYPDGRLQEAGGIIWRDGSGWNRGKFQDPESPEYNYLKEVDYCSAACVMIPKRLFEKVGGFDPKYAPAYYEDTDLAFKVAQAGYKVLYQPLSEVIHYEGATGGTDISAGTKKYQAINRATFTASWAQVLATKPENGDLKTYHALPAGQKRILVIDHHLPMPDRDSGSLRMFQILTILRDLDYSVTFLPDNLAPIAPYADELRKRGVKVIHHPYVKTVREYLQDNGINFDFVVLSRCDFARKHMADVRRFAPNGRIIFDTVDLHFLREEREAELRQSKDLKERARATRAVEYKLIDEADETWVVSPAEQALLQRDWPEKSIQVVSNIVGVPGSALPFEQRKDLLFIGSFQHPPNVDAVLFFAGQIFPLIHAQLPEVKFYIVGDKAPPEVIALVDENIIVTGFQPDVSSYFNTVRLSVAPLRYGAGVKGKINQSMGYGVPVVATSLAAEGMSLRAEKDAMIADDARSFAASVVTLYRSEELWRRLSQNGISKTKELYSVEAAREQIEKILDAPQASDHSVSPALTHALQEPVEA
jgi:GT2 family glycosyltransferase/glycosyltransferase involved in cell wall biosynthesis